MIGLRHDYPSSMPMIDIGMKVVTVEFKGSQLKAYG